MLKKCNQRNIQRSNIEDSDSDVETDSDSTIINDDAGNMLIVNDMTDNVKHVNIFQNTNEHNNSNNGSDVISIINPIHYLNDVFPFCNCDNDEFLSQFLMTLIHANKMYLKLEAKLIRNIVASIK